MRYQLTAALFLCFSFATVPVSAQGSTAEADLIVIGSSSANGDLQLRLEFGEAFQHGAKIYSEPSHTLLALVLGIDYAKTSEGQTLRGDTEVTQRTAVVTTTMPGGAPSLGGLWPQASDDRIAVWTLTGENAELIADAKTDLRQFEFEVSLSDPSVPATPTSEIRNKVIKHCSSSPCALEGMCGRNAKNAWGQSSPAAIATTSNAATTTAISRPKPGR
ncbi:MAG: hypothetical protein AAGD01_15430 [Acidobacteriota bacterium]